ncbi:2407_t:CDS:1, partial [Ambispora gerdemannii]
QQCPNTKVEIDENGTNIYTDINLDLLDNNQLDNTTVEVLPKSSIPILNMEGWTEHEQRIILGINGLIQAGPTLETLIKWPA